MSNADGLVLHLPLNEKAADGLFHDASGHGHDALPIKDVAVVADDVFGASVCFAGGHLEVRDSPDLRIAGDITLEVWVCLTEPPSDYISVISKGASACRNYCLWYHNRTYAVEFQRMVGQALQDCRIPTSLSLKLNNWYHIAGVLQRNVATLFVHDSQGAALLRQPQTAGWTGSSVSDGNPLRIGDAGYRGSHKGRLANVRIYNRALSEAEIRRDVRDDCMGLTAFRSSHPVHFRVYDDDEAPVIYISDDSAGRRLHLELRNMAAQPIRLRDGAGKASQTDHHFALRFLRGTLSEKSLGAIRVKPDGEKREWDVIIPPPAAGDEAVSMYLLYTGASKELWPGQPRVLTLENVNAAPGSGSRGAQVQLVPHPTQLTYAGGDATPITGLRTQHIHVSSHVGRKHIPLHVGFVDTNRVLNDETTENRLRLRITNVSATPMSLHGATFVVSLDAEATGQSKEWALATADEAKDIDVTLAGAELRKQGMGGETPEWALTFSSESPLGSRKHLQIDIRKIVSSAGNGFANVYLRYENIPGYWEGQFVCPVEKGPLTCKKGRVGIGVLDPSEALEVKGSVKVTDKVGIGVPKPTEALEVAGNLKVTETLEARSLRLAAPAKPLVDPRTIELAQGWKPGQPLRWWKDTHGVIHLMGSFIHAALPADAEGRYNALYLSKEVFTLPEACVPQFGPHEFLAARVEMDNSTVCVVPLFVVGAARWGVPCADVRIEYLMTSMGRATDVRCTLDGISYLARG